MVEVKTGCNRSRLVTLVYVGPDGNANQRLAYMAIVREVMFHRGSPVLGETPLNEGVYAFHEMWNAPIWEHLAQDRHVFAGLVSGLKDGSIVIKKLTRHMSEDKMRIHTYGRPDAVAPVETETIVNVGAHTLPLQIRVVGHLPGTFVEEPLRLSPTTTALYDDDDDARIPVYVVRVDGDVRARLLGNDKLQEYIAEVVPTLQKGQEISVTGG